MAVDVMPRFFSKVLAWMTVLGLLGHAILPGAGTAAVAEAVLEDLRYQVDVWVLHDAARVRLTLKRAGEGRYVGEISGEALGMAALLSGRRRDAYQTEMVFRNGRLMPAVFREESRRRGRRHLKEYRFLYGQGRLEMWQWKESSRKMVRKWQTSLTESLFDPISTFYNHRLGFLGPVKEGDILKVPGIPHPQPEVIEVRMGPEGEGGRNVMVSLVNPAFENQHGVVYVTVNRDLVPTQAWTRVLVFGKIRGHLLPGGKFLQGPLDLIRNND